MKYQCANCKRWHEETWTTEESDAEAKRLFGVSDASENPSFAKICDDCFQAMKAAGYIPPDPACK